MPAKGRTIPSTTRPDHVLQYDSEMSRSLRRMDMSSSNLMVGQADPLPAAPRSPRSTLSRQPLSRSPLGFTSRKFHAL
jgi:hypothetical protein